MRKMFLALLYLPYLGSLYKKERCFESFLKEYLITTKEEYATVEEIERANLDFDYYISGSDQIWNTACYDFDWAFSCLLLKRQDVLPILPAWDPYRLYKSVQNLTTL